MLHFEQHGVTPSGHNDDWAELVSHARQRGAQVLRLRLVHEPLTRYERYEVMSGYDEGVAAGEEIRIFPIADFDHLDQDFWAFDEQIMRKMHYDDAGRQQGFDEVSVEEGEKGTIEFWRSVFERATPLSEFRKQLSSQTRVLSGEGRSPALVALGAAIRDLRVRQGLTQGQLRVRASISQSKLSKIETGNYGMPSLADVEAILVALQAGDDRGAILRQYEIAQLDPVSYRAIAASGVGEKQAQLLDIERNTRLFRVFEFAVLPGLLQTVEYSAALFEALGHSPEEALRAAEVRRERQALLRERGREFTFLVTEFALTSVPFSGADAHLAQSDQLDLVLASSHQRNVRFQIVPASNGFPAIAGNSSSIYDRRYVSAETTTREVIATKPYGIRDYERAFAAIELRSFDEQSSRALLRQAIARFSD